MEILKNPGKCKKILFVGEGNFSFSRILCESENYENQKIFSTCYEPEPISDTAQDNIEALKAKGIEIRLGFDATKMDVCDIGRFDLVVFMFPHIGGKMKIHKNRHLLKSFGLSAAQVLEDNGKVIVTLCDGQGGTSYDQTHRTEADTWQILKMMSFADLALTSAGKFQIEDFEGYHSYGYRSLDKPFHTQNGTIHVFQKFPDISEPSGSSKILEPPVYNNDISFWYIENDFDFQTFTEAISKASDKSVIEVKKIDQYHCVKSNRTSMTFRLKYCNWSHIIDPEDVMVLHYKIGEHISKTLSVKIR